MAPEPHLPVARSPARTEHCRPGRGRRPGRGEENYGRTAAEAPGSLGRPGCRTRGRSTRTSARSGCTWPPRERQPGRCRATRPQCAGSPLAYLLGQAGKTSWDQVAARDIQQWTVQLLESYSSAYASIQFRALRQFFKWRPAEEQSPDPMTRLRAPKVTVTAVPVFTA